MPRPSARPCAGCGRSAEPERKPRCRQPRALRNALCAPQGRGRGPHRWIRSDSSRSSPGWQKDAREVLNKPGSVRRPALPRSAVATITLGVPLPAPSSVLPGGSASSLDAACLDLLRVGFTLPATSPPPRWALTFRPRQDRGPHHFTLACAHPALPRHPPSAVYFLWHFPWGRPPWLLASTLLYGARTFLHPRRRFPAGGQRPRFGLPARRSLHLQCTGGRAVRSSGKATGAPIGPHRRSGRRQALY